MTLKIKFMNNEFVKSKNNDNKAWLKNNMNDFPKRKKAFSLTKFYLMHVFRHNYID